jgi:hypothetical protein
MINVNPHPDHCGRNPTPHDRAPNTDPVTLSTASGVFDLAAQDPTLRVSVFQSDWAGIDLNRARAARAGLSDRLTFHHKLAYLCPLVRAAMARARAVFIDDP